MSEKEYIDYLSKTIDKEKAKINKKLFFIKSDFILYGISSLFDL